MWQGAVGVVPQDGLVSPDYVVARPIENINIDYFGFLFKTDQYLAEFLRQSHGIVLDRNRLYWEDFKSIYAIFPPKKEQDQIVEFLNDYNEQFEYSIVKIQDQVTKLKEYKSTLIDAAVTGKVKVGQDDRIYPVK